MTRLFKDMDVAQEKMRRNPVAFTDAISDAIGKVERGAHHQRHKGIALCVGISRVISEDFEKFEDLRSAACLQEYKKIQAATENDFKEHVPFAVVARSFAGTEVTENRMRVYGYVTTYFAGKSVPVSRICDKIKEMKGIDGVYDKIKAKKSEAQGAEDEVESADSRGTGSRASTQSKHGSGEHGSSKRRKRERNGTGSPESSGSSLTVEGILENYLLVKMSPEELEGYRDSSVRRGHARRLEIVYGGLDAHGLREWECVYSHSVDSDLQSRENNDNLVDYEDDDVA